MIFFKLFFLLAAINSWAVDPAQIDALVVKYHRENQFNGNVLVVKEGKELFFRSIGLADRNHNLPHTRKTKFIIGSVSKQFTAAGILKLVEDGKLNLADPASKYLEVPASFSDITIHELLSHQGRIARDIPLARKEYGVFHQLNDLIASLFSTTRTEGEKKFSYSNAGYTLLAFLIEKVSGQDFETFMSTSFYSPLGMESTGEYFPSKILPNMARGYVEHKGELFEACCIIPSNWLGAGTTYSTIDDLYRWTSSLFSGQVFLDGLEQKLFTPYAKMELPGAYYGYGWIVQRNGKLSIWHNGDYDGFVSKVSFFPEDELTVIILSNLKMDLSAMSDEIAKAL